MPEKSKLKVRRKRSPAAAAFDALTTGALTVISMIVVVVVVSLELLPSRLSQSG